MADRIEEVSIEYKSAIQDLTFNSKPLINALTMLAEDNKDFGTNIVQVICDRIKKVDVAKKLPSLYLLDSILKNVGNEYIQVISRVIAETFCHVFESAIDERNRLSLFKLRKTWTQYFPTQILHAIDLRSSKTDPNWPIMANNNATITQQVEQQNKIHINPRFLQSNAEVGNFNDYNGNPKEQISQGDNAKLEKMQKDREQHEQHLKQKKIEREKVLADQKRQIELLKKQQQIQQQPLQVNTTSTKAVKDPRLRTTSPVPSEGMIKQENITLLDTATHNTAKLSPKGLKKGKALSVVNKIVNNLAGKKPKQTKKNFSTAQSSNHTLMNQAARNWDGTLSSKSITASSGKRKDTSIEKSSLLKQEKKIATGKLSTEKIPSHVPTPPPPFSADFSGLSSKDMQIAAQAAAIATAMHQMQSVVKGPIAPEQSAQLAAQFIKMLQSSSQETSTSTVVTISNESNQSSTQITSSTSTISTTGSSLSVKIQDKVGKSTKIKSEPPKHESDSHNKNVSESTIGNATRLDIPKSSSEKANSKASGTVNENKSKSAAKPEDSSTAKKGTDKNKDRKGRDRKYEPPTKKSKDSGELTERPRKARARSPSRYYCQIEHKRDTEKQVEENKKELNLQRERKISESEENLDERAREQKKVYQSYISHIEALEKRFEQPNSKISVKTLESVFKQFEMKYKKRMMSSEQYNILADRLDKFASSITGSDTKVGNRRIHHNETYSPKKNKNGPESHLRDFRPPPFRNDIRPMIGPDGRPLGPDGPFPPHGFVPRVRGSRFMRPPPPHWGGPPPEHFQERFPPHFRNVPPHMMEGPPIMHQMDPMGRQPFPPMEHDGMVPPRQMGMHHPPSGMDMPPQPYPDMPHQPYLDMPNHGQPLPPHWDAPPMDYPPWRDSPPPHMMMQDDQQMQHMEGPPGVMPMGQMQHPHRNSPIPGFSEHSQPLPETDVPALKPTVDVGNLLGQLMASGLIGANVEEEEETVPEMSLKIEELKKRNNVLVKQLFLGMQCSSCGERFPKSHKKQYSDHLDWHFRENKKEKEGGKKVISRSWYFELSDWVEYSDFKVGEDGKVQSAFFESEKGEESNHIGRPSKRTSAAQSVPVEGDEGGGVCGVCMDTLEEYWDEDLEEWRYKNAVRKENKTYHVACQDYAHDNDELDETVTPIATPAVEKSFVLMDESSEALATPDDSEGIVPPGTESEISQTDISPRIIPPGTKRELSQTICESVSPNINNEVATRTVPPVTEGDPSQNHKSTTPLGTVGNDIVPSIIPLDTECVLSLAIDPHIVPPGTEDELSPTDNDIVPPGTENEFEEQMDFVSIKEEETKMEVDPHVTTTSDNITPKIENNDTEKESQITNDNKTNIKIEPLEDDYMDSAADSPEYPLIPSERISSEEKLNPSSVVSEG